MRSSRASHIVSASVPGAEKTFCLHQSSIDGRKPSYLPPALTCTTTKPGLQRNALIKSSIVALVLAACCFVDLPTTQAILGA